MALGALFLFTVPAHAFPIEGGDGTFPIRRPPDGDLRVIVVDATTDMPVAQAAVQVRGRTVSTNAQGRVTLAVRSPAPTIRVSAPGYLPASFIYLGERTKRVSLRPREFSGKVSDASTGALLANALIYDSSGRFVQVDSQGFFRFPDLDADAHLRVKVPGYRLGHFVRGAAVSADFRLLPFQTMGVYIPFGLLASASRVRAIMDAVQHTELNTVIVDVKGDRGRLAYASQVPLAQEIGAPQAGLMDIGDLVRKAHRRDIYVVARLVVFKDEPLAVAHPEWATLRADGTLWRDRENLAWGNPFRSEVQNYNIAIAKEVAGLGFDEIQFDYVRFPSDGDIHNIVFGQKNTAETRRAAIGDFMSRLSTALSRYAVFTSGDVFGLVPWVNGEMGIGQEMENIAPYVDYLCPMVYPSTFAPGSMGFENPSLHPYDIVFRSVTKARSRTTTIIRPWLQHYSLNGVTYGRDEFLIQRQAAERAGSGGWAYWNAGGKYDFSLFAPQP